MTDGTEETVDATRVPSGVAEVDGTVDAGDDVGRPSGAVAGLVDRGVLIGRYVVLSKLGAGAMGVVLAAYDPELDRKVALKLLKARQGGGTSAARPRLQREAQALAKLNHPNVVGVHDVGVHEGRVFVAMEFVEGQTLGEWMKAATDGAPRPWRDVVRVFQAAGRGLAAAHAEGLVHRDFKPDNVMLGVDGGVRVMDFGLARIDDRGEPADFEGSEAAAAVTDLRLTRTGAILGTPAYMSPEQFEGQEVTARSDQFGFAIALFEALFGVRPFPGNTLPQLAHAVTEGELITPPPEVRVPAWLTTILGRALSPGPAQRFPDMAGLLVALDAGGARRRRLLVYAAAGSIALGAAGWAGYRQWDERERVADCTARGQAVDAIWNADARAGLGDALRDTGTSYAEETLAQVVHYVDAQSDAIRGAETKACVETRVHENWTEDRYERATWCLEERRMELEAKLDQLMDVDARTIRRAVPMAAGLSHVEPCIDGARLDRVPVPPRDGERERIRKVRETLSEASALQSAGRFDDAVTVATRALEEAQDVGWPALVAAARRSQGWARADAGDYPGAESALETAYFEASEVGAQETAADAAIQLAYTVGYSAARYSDGQRWGKHASVALTSLGEAKDGLRWTELSNDLGLLHEAKGEYAEAQALHERTLAAWEKRLGPDHPELATSLSNLATVHDSTGAYAEAKALLVRALAIEEASLGAQHPNVADSLSGLANVEYDMGEFAEAEALDRRALAIREAALGPDHPDVAASLSSLAVAHKSRGAYAEAKTLQERALAILEQRLGPDHPNVASSVGNLANVHAAMGDHETAKRLNLRGAAIWEKVLGPEHPQFGSAINNLANTHYELGEYDAAVPLYERALAIFEKALGSAHPVLAYPVNGLAKVAVARGDAKQGVVHAQRAIAVREGGEAPAVLVAESQFILAQALWEASEDGGVERKKAIALAEGVREVYRSAKDVANDLKEVEAWLVAAGG